jgi:type 1 fimbria pilin
MVSIAYAVLAVAPSTAWVAQQADGTITFPGNTTNGPLLSFRPSANVVMAYDVDTTGVVFSLGSAHTSGIKIYSTSSQDTKIYMRDFAAGTVMGSLPLIPANTTVGTSTQWGAGWSALK